MDVSSSNFPRFDVNPNTGEPLNNHRRMITATNTIYHDAGHPSHIVLPLVPAGKSSAEPRRPGRHAEYDANWERHALQKTG